MSSECTAIVQPAFENKQFKSFTSSSCSTESISASEYATTIAMKQHSENDIGSQQHPQYIETLFDLIDEEESNSDVDNMSHIDFSKSTAMDFESTSSDEDTSRSSCSFYNEEDSKTQQEKYGEPSSSSLASDLPSATDMLQNSAKSILAPASKLLGHSQGLIRSVFPSLSPSSNSSWSNISPATSPSSNLFKHFHSSLLGMASPQYISYKNLNTTSVSSPRLSTTSIPQYLCRKQWLQQKPSSTSQTSPSDSPFVNEPRKQACGFGVGKKYAPPRSLDDSDYTEQCGEDAFFTFENESFTIIGVADGVGGWIDQGVDPSHISNQLMLNCKLICEREINNPSFLSNPNKIMQAAYEMIVNEKQVQAGSTTCCVASFDKKNNILRTSNLGDSTCAVFRNGACIFVTQERQHYFNCPFQLGVVPAEISTAYHDLPEHAVNEEIVLQPEDVIVMATDGVWDNLFPEDIGTVIIDLQDNVFADASQGSNASTPLQSHELAKRITLHARTVSLDRNARTPFAVGSGFRFIGGKFDDITTVCFIA
ncbi:hypothetical protein C9374_005389 [Naegleria lovaniensis]|uniref:Protein phosphatase n=1 Tax=Naegleria lovaniensis TaxID=51637 RepID=A0AA88KIG7_NAELO|nr:uncharacterized protein C9374_005389 [Naegleria lovaniensis]KAG2382187.1 hypothetical protein C9374_005389 [Naegleria lovaniensis]